MSYGEFAKIAVALREHPKVLRAGDDAGWLFVCAILWSKEHDTDGFIPTYAASRLTGFRQYRNVLRKCVEAGLMEPRDDGWLIHDYLDHQESAERRRAAGRKAASVRWSQNADAIRIATASESQADRNATAMRDRITEEEEEEEREDPPTPESEQGKVVTFDRKPVPTARLQLAERILDEFNRQAGTGYGAFTGRGRPSEDLKRILSALADASPPMDADEAARIIRWRLAEPFWSGRPHTGVVFGPNVFPANRESASSNSTPRRSVSSADLGLAIRAAAEQPRGGAA